MFKLLQPSVHMLRLWRRTSWQRAPFLRALCRLTPAHRRGGGSMDSMDMRWTFLGLSYEWRCSVFWSGDIRWNKNFVLLPIYRKSKVRYSRHMDIGTAVGFLATFEAVRRLVKGGLLWLGAPCSSWVWISRGSTQRCRIRPQGSRKVASVLRMNRLVRRLCYL